MESDAASDRERRALGARALWRGAGRKPSSAGQGCGEPVSAGVPAGRGWVFGGGRS
ncbi:hypothetical protein KCH_62410 [Kitasatospora cheerisanensis KCTC 2395]|uniref:Uncharacterized protein n=1 Tax=Kitasatospora cheerisanensis KCTC 2395 TaxID=1348663 RepID=A0A066YLQ3_9ACTN|nr:hypothetical protein KCH_62410 [Kitasatospora cheerisanensis KCTC 2395]